jgi:hypothetical protein
MFPYLSLSLSLSPLAVGWRVVCRLAVGRLVAGHRVVGWRGVGRVGVGPTGGFSR